MNEGAVDNGARDAVYGKLLVLHGDLIRYAAERMSIPGKLDVDEQEQNGRLLLLEVLTSTLNGGIYQFTDPFSVDFVKVFKTGLWWRLTQNLNSWKAQCRHHQKDVSANMRDESTNEEFTLWDVDPEISRLSGIPMPDEVLESKEIIEEVKAQLPPKGQEFVDLLVDPTPMKGLILEYMAGKKRVHLGKGIPFHLYRTYLGMKRFPFEDLVHTVRGISKEVMSQYVDMKRFLPVPVPQEMVPVSAGSCNFETESVGC